MQRVQGRFVLAVAVVCATLAPRGASAQFGPAGGGGFSSSGTAGQYANPAANPMTNPFLNPYMAAYAQGNASNTQNAAMFFLAAQSASGGIGSGQLSGVRPGPATPRYSGRTPAGSARNPQGGPVAVRSSDIPGGGAARFFGSAAIARTEEGGPAPVRASDIPGAGAARYFGLAPQPSASASNYYNRSGRYYSARGR